MYWSASDSLVVPKKALAAAERGNDVTPICSVGVRCDADELSCACVLAYASARACARAYDVCVHGVRVNVYVCMYRRTRTSQPAGFFSTCPPIRSTQHTAYTARSTQHTARSTQHAAHSTAHSTTHKPSEGEYQGPSRGPGGRSICPASSHAVRP